MPIANRLSNANCSCPRDAIRKSRSSDASVLLPLTDEWPPPPPRLPPCCRRRHQVLQQIGRTVWMGRTCLAAAQLGPKRLHTSCGCTCLHGAGIYQTDESAYSLADERGGALEDPGTV